MLHWLRRFDTLQAMQSLPRMAVVASETQFDASYHYEGRRRQRESHCLFKYTLDGEGIFRDAAGEHRVPAEHGFLTRISDPETAYYYHPDNRQPWTFVWIAFVGPASEAMVDEMVSRYGHVYNLPRSSAAAGQLMSFAGSGEARTEVTPAEGAQVVLMLLLELARASQEARRENPLSVLVRKAQQLARDRAATGLNASELASELGVSREHLTRVFHEQAGVTPHKFLVRQRLLEACRMLRQTAMTNKEISSRLGYATNAHFARAFKEALGVTPGQFRESGMMTPVL